MVSQRGAGEDPAERMAFVAIDPLNLIRVIPAEGRDEVLHSLATSSSAKHERE